MNRYLPVSLILISLFIILAALVSPRINSNTNETPLHKADSNAFLQINHSHLNMPIDQLMILLTQYGREVVWIVAGVSLLIFGGRIGRKTVLIMALAMIVLIPIGSLAKDVVGRPRPAIPQDSLLIEPDKEFAFPSGHALLISAGAAVMLGVYRGSYKKLILSTGLAAEAALVCFSRVYVGGHYPLDVVGGIVLGAGVAFIFVSATKPIDWWILQPIAKILKR